MRSRTEFGVVLLSTVSVISCRQAPPASSKPSESSAPTPAISAYDQARFVRNVGGVKIELIGTCTGLGDQFECKGTFGPLSEDEMDIARASWTQFLEKNKNPPKSPKRFGLIRASVREDRFSHVSLSGTSNVMREFDGTTIDFTPSYHSGKRPALLSATAVFEFIEPVKTQAPCEVSVQATLRERFSISNLVGSSDLVNGRSITLLRATRAPGKGPDLWIFEFELSGVSSNAMPRYQISLLGSGKAIIIGPSSLHSGLLDYPYSSGPFEIEASWPLARTQSRNGKELLTLTVEVGHKFVKEFEITTSFSESVRFADVSLN